MFFLFCCSKKFFYHNSPEYVDSGYKKNAVVYRCVNEIATAFSSIKLELWQGDEVVDNKNHAAIQLLKRPNPMQGYDSFIKAVVTDWLTQGELAITRTPNSTELWTVSPLDVTVKPHKSGIPLAYEVGEGQKKVTFPVVAAGSKAGESDLLFHKFYNPTDHWRGLSPFITLPQF